MRNEIILRAAPQVDFAVNFLRGLKLDPAKPFVVTVEPYKKRRSMSQNSLLWKRHGEIVAAIGEYTGYSAEDVHELLKQKFLTPKVIEVNGETIRRYSSKGLSTAEFADFMTKIEIFAQTELGIILTNPEDRMSR